VDRPHHPNFLKEDKVSLENYWNEYQGSGWRETSSAELSGYGYVCPQCGYWVNCGESHRCHISPWTVRSYYPCLNKTEEAYKILKALVEKKIITEPDSFKKFCEIIEEIAKCL
jgi:hypothetical protein